MKTYEVEIKGTTPLLFNKFNEADITEKVKKRTGAFQEKNVADKLYKTEDGQIYTPATHLIGCIGNAAKEFKIPGKRTATYSKLVASSISVEPFAIVHKKQKWDVFSISAVIPATRGRAMVHRPRLNEWNLSFSVSVDDGVSEETLKNILDYAGTYVGIGDWRPQKKGQFGKFIVTKFELK
jgi:hypothetical protein